MNDSQEVKRSPKNPLVKSQLLVWLVGVISLIFGQGHFPNPVLPVLGIACWLWFCRRANAWLSVSLIVIGNIAVWETAYRGMVPLPVVARIGMEVGVSAVLVIVFLVDRKLHRREVLSDWLRTLAFPCGWVVFDLLNARLSPGATWSSIAYSYVDQEGLVQIAAVTGWTGLTFLVGWLATLANMALDTRRLTPGVVAAITVVSISCFGSLRLTIPSDTADPTNLSLLVTPDTYHIGDYLDEVWMYTRGVEHSEEQRDRAISQIERSLEENLRMVRHEAEAGSDLVVWAEANASLSEAEEADWIAAASAIAREFRIYLGMGLVVFRPNEQPPSANKLILIDPQGGVATDFLKRTRTPGASHAIGEGPLPTIATEFANLSAAICFDMDFPQVIATAASDIDAILAPSNDWTEAGPTHSRMARMRGIENGMWVIRPTKDGVSTVSDPMGRILASQVTDGQPQAVLRCQSKLSGVATPYTTIGDAFAWICTIAWFGMVAMSIRHPRRN